MTQTERRIFLITSLLDEQRYTADIPSNEQAQKRLLRTLLNLRPPAHTDERFKRIQDEYLKEEINQKGITDIRDLTPIENGIYLWQGDITTLRCDAIVNAANPQLLGCFCPCHGCIDNAIHTYAGTELRLACAEIMKKQGHDGPSGSAKITPAFNLPCRYVIHTVGPIISGQLTNADTRSLASCYRSCLALAEEAHLGSIAFPCISTGEYHFPNEAAANTAVNAVREYLSERPGRIEVIFNVFKDIDFKIYRELLG
ncbi:MAG: protein-ADP-ribose hydrolase [Eubacteriales bacterium]